MKKTKIVSILMLLLLTGCSQVDGSKESAPSTSSTSQIEQSESSSSDNDTEKVKTLTVEYGTSSDGEFEVAEQTVKLKEGETIVFQMDEAHADKNFVSIILRNKILGASEELPEGKTELSFDKVHDFDQIRVIYSDVKQNSNVSRSNGGSSESMDSGYAVPVYKYVGSNQTKIEGATVSLSKERDNVVDVERFLNPGEEFYRLHLGVKGSKFLKSLPEGQTTIPASEIETYDLDQYSVFIESR